MIVKAHKGRINRPHAAPTYVLMSRAGCLAATVTLSKRVNKNMFAQNNKANVLCRQFQACHQNIRRLLYQFKLYKKFSCRRETARCFVSLNISLCDLRSFEMAPFDNNNNNNNKHDNVYGAVIMAEPLREFTRFI